METQKLEAELAQHQAEHQQVGAQLAGVQEESARLGQARGRVERAEREQASAAVRLAESMAELERLTAEIRTCKPDDVKAMARLVAARETANGQAESLEARASAAAAELADAKAEAAEAEIALRRAEITQLDAQARELDRQLNQESLEAAERLRAKVVAIREIVRRANRLEMALDPRSSLHSWVPMVAARVASRGTYWANVLPTGELLSASHQVAKLTGTPPQVWTTPDTDPGLI